MIKRIADKLFVQFSAIASDKKTMFVDGIIDRFGSTHIHRGTTNANKQHLRGTKRRMYDIICKGRR
jgi:hypothetical protein